MATEALKYQASVLSETRSTTDVPIVKTEVRTVTYTDGRARADDDAGVLVSAQALTSATRTIETTTVRPAAAAAAAAWTGPSAPSVTAATLNAPLRPPPPRPPVNRRCPPAGSAVGVPA